MCRPAANGASGSCRSVYPGYIFTRLAGKDLLKFPACLTIMKGGGAATRECGQDRTARRAEFAAEVSADFGRFGLSRLTT